MVTFLAIALAVASSSDECGSYAGCTKCTEAGCVWSGVSCALACTGDTCATTTSMCCAADPNHGKLESWLCDDKCNTCSCSASGDEVVAFGCAKDDFAEREGEGPPSESTESWLVRLALLPVAACFVCGVAICYLMVCYKKAGKKLSEKELNRDEEADQLAAGD